MLTVHILIGLLFISTVAIHLRLRGDSNALYGTGKNDGTGIVNQVLNRLDYLDRAVFGVGGDAVQARPANDAVSATIQSTPAGKEAAKMNQCHCEDPTLCIHVVAQPPADASPEVQARYAARNRLNAAMRASQGESGFDINTNEPVAPIAPANPAVQPTVLRDYLVRDYGRGAMLIVPLS